MTNALYAHAKQLALDTGIGWTVNDIKAVLVDNTHYTVDLVNHQFLSDVPVLARVAISPNMTGKSTTGGAANCDPFSFVAVTGPVCEVIIFYTDHGTDTISPLIAYFDTATILPVTPNGGNIPITPDTGVDKLFAFA
jgi:hypothetical protein